MGAALTRAGPVGAGRHHGFTAAISIAAAGGALLLRRFGHCTDPGIRPERLKPPQRKRKAPQTARGFTCSGSGISAERRGTHPCRTCRRRPTSRFHSRDFNRRGGGALLLRRFGHCTDAGIRPERLKPPQRKRKAPQTARGFTCSGGWISAERHGTHPRRTCRRRPTSRFHSRDFNRRGGGRPSPPGFPYPVPFVPPTPPPSPAAPPIPARPAGGSPRSAPRTWRP
jgi:hypothetical protein